MVDTYLGILRGKILPIEASALILLKSGDDKVFFLETKQISGYTTKLTLKNALNNAKEEDPEDKQLNILLEEMRKMKINESYQYAAADVEKGDSLLSWIGVE